MSEHTPGPWTIRGIQSSGLSIMAHVEIGKEDMSGGQLQPIYEVSIKPHLQIGDDGRVHMDLTYESWRQFPSIDFQEMQKANARLIAASPDLLAACRAALEDCQSDDWAESGLGKQLQAAIAKAEGES